MQAINSSDGLFHDGNPATSQPGTIVTAAWLNAIQGELLSVLVGAGIAPDAAKQDQVKAAITKLIQNGVTLAPGVFNRVTVNDRGQVTAGDQNIVFDPAQGFPVQVFRKNALINGNFDIWQRGPGPFTSYAYTADRWYQSSNGSTISTTRQSFALGQPDVPSEPTHFLRTAVTSVAGTNNYATVVQKIESVRTFAGKKVTLTFRAKADGNKNVAVSFSQTFGTGGAHHRRRSLLSAN
ncbi:hypothetical protein OL229_04355 [Neisseriaceae bacterium JH1-16]|nr:hypothetical protein [Neisseriaceae bacterium JH1-16]